MTRLRLPLTISLLLSLVGATRAATAAAVTTATVHDVRSYGARGDGRALDTAAINRAIDAAAAAGGGTVVLPPGSYRSFSIHLRSHVTLQLSAGATLVAASPGAEGRYDLPEPNPWEAYQDFGHSHWQNSLIWGVGLEDVAIVGPGRIDGAGLTRRGPGAPWKRPEGDRPLSMGPQPPRAADPEATEQRAMDGQGNKAIALKLCRNVLLRDLTILKGGHFALLATGVDNLTIDNLRIDTDRDGLDVDACRNVRISNTSVNSPNDDAIVLKSSFALGEARATENVTITNCQVSGYDLGSLLDGTFRRTQEHAPDRDGPTGRIKLGTESNGGFRNITVSNCVFDRSRGLALETVDGGVVEDVAISNITMRGVTTAPLFLRVGNRGRGPGEVPVGAMRRVQVDNLVAWDVEPRYAAIIAGIPGHPVEDVSLSNVRIVYKGGVAAEGLTDDPPEHEGAYPEPSMFGTLPAYGFFLRHARNVSLRGVEISFARARDDLRPPLMLVDVADVHLDQVKAARAAGVPFAVLRDVRTLAIHDSPGLPDTTRERVVRETLGLPTVFLVGDSTVHNGKGDGANGQWGWGEPLAAFLDPAKVNLVNRALGGRSSRTFQTEGHWQQVLDEMKPGDFVLIQFGHNDAGELFKGNRPRASLPGTGEDAQEGTVEMTGRHEIVHSYGWYLRRYVCETLAKGATPIVCSPVPRKIWKEGRVVRADHAPWAADLARAEGAAFLDLGEIIARRYEALGPAKVETLFADEHTHTNAEGAELNAAAVVVGLRALPGCPLCPFLSAKGQTQQVEAPGR